MECPHKDKEKFIAEDCGVCKEYRITCVPSDAPQLS